MINRNWTQIGPQAKFKVKEGFSRLNRLRNAINHLVVILRTFRECTSQGHSHCSSWSGFNWISFWGPNVICRLRSYGFMNLQTHQQNSTRWKFLVSYPNLDWASHQNSIWQSNMLIIIQIHVLLFSWKSIFLFPCHAISHDITRLRHYSTGITPQALGLCNILASTMCLIRIDAVIYLILCVRIDTMLLW